MIIDTAIGPIVVMVIVRMSVSERLGWRAVAPPDPLAAWA